VLAACGRIGFDASDEGERDEVVAEAYAQAVLADGPIAYFRFDEHAGPDAISEVGGVRGTYLGDFEFGAIGAVGDSTVVFDGLSTLVDLGDQFRFAGTTPYTFEAWIYPYSIEDHTLFIVDRGGPAGDGYQFYVGDTYALFSRETAGAEFAYATGDAPPPLRRWTHLVATYDGVVSYLYVNGERVGSNPLNSPQNAIGDSAGTFSIGDHVPSQFYKWNGRIDELAIYPTALGAEQIVAHYQLGR
jgi:hypothetical protein